MQHPQSNSSSTGSELLRPLTWRRVIGIGLLALLLNCLLFAAYRLVFLSHSGTLHNWSDTFRVLIYGARLDVALLGFEFALVGLVTLALRHLQLRRLILWVWGLTALHAFICVANYSTFLERNQNAGDLILPYITSPRQVYLAVMPFCEDHWILMLILVAGASLYIWMGWRLAGWMSRAWNSMDLWRNTRAFSVALVFALLPLMMTWQPIIKQKRKTSNTGITPKFASSKFYTQFSDYHENEAVMNPLYEFIGEQIPTAFNKGVPFRMTEAEALNEWEHDNGMVANSTYPFMQTVQGMPESSIENAVIIQVEGLSGSVLQQERKGKAVTPFLRKLAKEGVYFYNTIQNANFTSGGVFSTASGVPKGTWDEPTRRFASYELHGYYGSLAHILGSSNYTHYFSEGFRQSGDDFLSFMSYQGCQVLNYDSFKTRLEDKHQLEDADTLLGIHDGYMMQETADLLEQCPGHFTAHLMTCSTHSPWKVPPSFGTPFDEPELNTFAYLDASIEAFVNRIENSPKLREHTLIVVLGDHTSVTFGNNLMERIRIPLIFYAPNLPHPANVESEWACQVDVVPSVLGLMKGSHSYAGMGRNLFDTTTEFKGVTSGTRDTGYFVTHDWLLRYHPFGGKSELFALHNGEADPDNLAIQNPHIVAGLEEECFARVELTKRLGIAKRIYSPSGGISPAALASGK